ncbi:hypothetical protein MMC32_008250 [Xylographa parallela]|nr:hypothetical protein [Xylographa parallela]
MEAAKEPSAPRIDWNPNMFLALAEGLRDQQRLRPSNIGFKAVAWNAVIPDIQTQDVKPGVIVRIEACRSKLSNPKKTWWAWKKLTEETSGFGIDTIMSHPKALANADIFRDLFLQGTATGNAAETASSVFESLLSEFDSNLDPSLRNSSTISAINENLPLSSTYATPIPSAAASDTSSAPTAPAPRAASALPSAFQTPSASKKKKESPITSELQRLHASIDAGNAIVARAIEQQLNQETDIAKAIKILVKEYQQEGSAFIQQAIQVLKQEANAQVFNCLDRDNRDSFIRVEIDIRTSI